MRRACAMIVLLASAGCSWSRFDDLEDNAPVVLLDEPGGIGSGFGASLASIGTTEDAHVLVGAARGQPGAAEFRIGFGQNPGVDANDSAHCKGDCTLASTIAGLQSAATSGGPRERCWATGLTAAAQITVRCDDGAPSPDDVRSVPVGVTIAVTDRFVLASDAHADPTPALAAATSAGSGSAWFYAPLDLTPRALTPPSADPGFGSSIAVARDPGRIYAVGAPGASRVWLFAASADDASVASLGCISGGAGFGRTLAVGDVDATPGDELVVAEDEQVVVVRDLASLAQGGACTPVEPSIVVRLSCASTADVSGCGPQSDFGHALAVADLNGDGNGEVVVGAPGLNVRDEDRAGALLVYDVEFGGAKQPEWLTDAKFISSAGSGDALGTAIAAVRQRPAGQNSRDVLVAGAPGGDKAAMFYCFELPSGKRGARCE